MLTVFRHHIDDETSIKSACRVATGRSAILHFARRYKPEVVFMPGYVAEGVINPFHLFGAIIVFYKLNGWLMPDFDDLKQKMEQNKGTHPVIVLIHYFGNRASTFEAEKIARAHGGVVLSDCSHCVPYGDGFWKADLTLYSLNKFLPVTDGALLSSRRADIDVSLDESELQPLPVGIRHYYSEHLMANRRLANSSWGDETFNASVEASQKFYDLYYSHINSDMGLYSQSALSRSIEAETDLREMKWLRQAKSNDLCDQLLPQFFIYDQSCQFAFPIKCGGKREQIATALCEAGIFPGKVAERWDHIPPTFQIERNFFNDHLLLPIGENISRKAITLMAEIVNNFGKRV